ncbi:MAG: hypothetical protein KGL39_04705 [Patescibacteria group bacterium]|nr:hypothetical protein [Patescibacteria group bacterium]
MDANETKCREGLKLPMDMHILHMLGGRASGNIEVGNKYVQVEAIYLRELVKIAKEVGYAGRTGSKQ